jgi:hypothetical protein
MKVLSRLRATRDKRDEVDVVVQPMPVVEVIPLGQGITALV